jgi:predicted nucleic acid-binding protein
MIKSSLLIYIDANAFMYALEGAEEIAENLQKLFSIFRDKPGSAITSELTLAEVLPKRRVPDRQFFDLLVWSKIFDLRPVTRDILVQTAGYRRAVAQARSDGRMPPLPDAIVVALQSNCGVFLSSDVRIKLPDTIRQVRADATDVAALIHELT